MAHSYKSGRFSRAFVGNGAATNMVELDLISFEVNPSVEKAIFTTSKTGLFKEKETTFPDCTFTIVVEHNYLASAYGTSGGSLTMGGASGGGTFTAQLFLNNSTVSPTLGTTNAAGAWFFPQAIMVGNPQSVVIDGKTATRFMMENSGIWYEPTT